MIGHMIAATLTGIFGGYVLGFITYAYREDRLIAGLREEIKILETVIAEQNELIEHEF